MVVFFFCFFSFFVLTQMKRKPSDQHLINFLNENFAPPSHSFLICRIPCSELRNFSPTYPLTPPFSFSSLPPPSLFLLPPYSHFPPVSSPSSFPTPASRPSASPPPHSAHASHPAEQLQ